MYRIDHDEKKINFFIYSTFYKHKIIASLARTNKQYTLKHQAKQKQASCRRDKQGALKTERK